MAHYETPEGKRVYIDGYLLSNLTRFKEMVLQDDLDCILLVDGGEGCISGDTIINTNRFTLGRKRTIKQLYNGFHNNPDGLKHFQKWNLNEPTYVRSFNGKEIKLHKIKDVMYSGKKEVHRLTLDDGTNIKATADHKFLTKNEGWIELQHLFIGQEVMCDSLHAVKKSKRKKLKLYDIQLSVGGNHPYSFSGKRRIEVHRLIYEAYLNNLKFMEYLDILLNEPEQCKSLKFVNPDEYDIHHIDGNHYNNDIKNLKKVNKSEHNVEDNIYSNFSQGVPIFKKVSGKEYVGVEDTYDICCDEPNHNFVANGIIVHNSGKSVLAQQMAKFLDPSFGIDDICFSGNQFKKAVINAKKYKCIIFDEALSALNKMKSISALNVSVVDLLAEVRQKNLFIIIILPSFFDLTKNISAWRSRALFHVYMRGEKFQRGFFNAYSYDKKLQLYISGKKYYNYHGVSPSFYGRFLRGYQVDETEYRKLKLTNLRAYGNEEVTEENKAEKKNRYKLYKLIDHLIESGSMSRTELCEVTEMTGSTLNSFLFACKEDFVDEETKQELEAMKLSRRLKEEITQIRKKDKSFSPRIKFLREKKDLDEDEQVEVDEAEKEDGEHGG